MDPGKAAELMQQAEQEGDDYWDDAGGEWKEEWDEEEGGWDEEDDGGEDDEEEWEEDDEGELYDDNGQLMVQIRPTMGGRNRMRNVGLHTIEIYYPQFFFKQVEMEEYDARPDRYGPSVIGKYTKGIGQIEGRLPTDDEDPVSFAMTAVHRLIDRMDKQGFNETYKYAEDGKMIPPWNSVGRLDIGSESLVDRSKSMKAYVMDLFERYGGGDCNIEGVDMYNACYGGQAAGLCVQNWVESDRWDGRYGIAVSTDISDAPHSAIFTVGAACTAGLYYPDAPLPHHSHRASCIQHRFDFFKPVGWFHMGPVVDGKYSIDAYMNCVDACYQTLRKKMNDRPLLQITDYNVFHTGGGWHVVKKAFERCIRSEDPKTPAEVRAQYVQEKLIPSGNLLKIIGPCHTVSSWLNISSVNMSMWDQALGKVILVFTYGSGCASSMYQLRFDDLLWQDPLAVWKARTFYRDCIYLTPEMTRIHDVYVDTWMKFDYRPIGRKLGGFGYETLQMDAYYLMEIDPWGRRFYHRGGMRAGPLKEELQNNTAKHYDKLEGRKTRVHFGDLPASGRHDKVTQEKAGPALALEDKWKALELEMTYDAEVDGEIEPQIIQAGYQKGLPEHRLVVVEKPERAGGSLEKDGLEHKYQIVGTWTSMKEAQEMALSPNGAHTFEIVLGANQWEQFYLIQDRDRDRKIYPAFERSWKDMPCVGPHKGPVVPQCWLLSGLPNDELPDEDLGQPGDKYLVSFKWERIKTLTWEKLEGRNNFAGDDGVYHVSGSWTCWDLVQLSMDPDRPGHYSLEVQKTRLGLEFHILRNKDPMQRICPDVEEGYGDEFSKVALIGGQGQAKNWNIEGDEGELFCISLLREPGNLADISVSWERTGSRPAGTVADRYFLAGTLNDWGTGGAFDELVWRETAKAHVCELVLKVLPVDFQILQNKTWDKCIHPDKADCSQTQAHEVQGPGPRAKGLCWRIGKSAADKAKVGDTFVVSLTLETLRVSWRKRG